MDDRRPQVFAVTLSMFVIATLVVIFRFISCIVIVRKVAIHDYIMLLAWVLAFGFCFSICYGASKGLGRHEDDVPPESQIQLLKSEYAFSVLYNPALMAVKTSILVFYFTLTGREKIFLWVNCITIALINVAGLVLTFLNIFQCSPYRATFEYPVPEGADCIDIVTLYLSSAPVNIITDLVILFLPLPILTAMTLPRKQKIILLVTFGFGAFVTIIDVIRIAYFQNASVVRLDNRGQGKKNYGPNDDLAETDYSWYASLSFMWSAVEINTGIICACVPLLKPLVNRVLPRMIKDTGDHGIVPSIEVSGQDLPPLSVPQGEQNTAPVRRRQRTDSIVGPETTLSRGINNIDEERQPVSMVDFLTATGQGQQDHQESSASGTSNLGDGEQPRHFDFVKIKTRKNMLKMTNRESIFPNAMATILFFIWGFAYGLLSALNARFEDIVEAAPTQSLGLRASFFAAYLVGGLVVGRQALKHWSFKGSFVTGLFIYAGGTLVFWPSAVLFSYPALVVSNFIVGLGLSVLETAANPFIILCGPMENSEVRLNISQGFQAIGAVVSPLLANKAFFKNTNTPESLINAQWAYLGIAFSMVLLAIMFYYLRLPDASDADLKELADRRTDNFTKVCGVPVVWITLGLGVFAQFCYVGGQEVFYIRIEPFVEAMHLNTHVTPFDFNLIGHSLFAISRFLTAFVEYHIKPRWVLLVLYIGLITASILSMNLKGSAGLAMALLIYLFEGGIFPTIFATSLRGTGKHTKTSAAIMTAFLSSGAIFPFIQDPLEDARGIAYSFCVLVALFAGSSVFAIYLNLIPAAKRQVDPVSGENLRRRYRSHIRHAPARACLVNKSLEPPTRDEENGSKGFQPQLRNKLGIPLSILRKSGRSEGDGKEKSDNSGSSRSSRDRPAGEGGGGGGGDGGIMHGLAPWPSPTALPPSTGDSSTPIVSGGRE